MTTVVTLNGEAGDDAGGILAKAGKKFLRRLQMVGLILLIAGSAAADLLPKGTRTFVPYAAALMVLLGSLSGEGVRVFSTLSAGLAEIGLVSLLLDALKVGVLPLSLQASFWLAFAALTANTALSMVKRTGKEASA
ncbi:MAG: hypothetical protein M1357_02660 [Candidatus Marsarchaeota archaeon]|nr:hypothetical protein [Candidatus Marsarchaeota archaeon]